jgi:hypothetical protein
MYGVGDTVVVNDRMQRNYRYEIVARTGEDFMAGFEPKFSPAEMLATSATDRTRSSIISESKAASRFPIGRRKVGSSARIQGGGFSGIAAIIWGGGYRR